MQPPDLEGFGDGHPSGTHGRMGRVYANFRGRRNTLSYTSTNAGGSAVVPLADRQRHRGKLAHLGDARGLRSVASPVAAQPGFARSRKWGYSVQGAASLPEVRHRLREGVAGRPSTDPQTRHQLS